jgi:hypothetical protein
MKVKANDTIHIDSAGGTKQPGEEFEVNDTEGQQLLDRGLVSKVPASAANGKQAQAPKNKAARNPANKAAR